MWVVAAYLKIFKCIAEDIGGLAPDVQLWVGARLARQLQLHLLVMVAVNVAVSARPDELPHLQIALLRHHVGQQGIAGDVEGHAQKDVGAALVKLATEFAARHIKLKKGMAGHERHFVQLGHVPAAHDQAARIGVGFDLLQHLRNLVDMPAVRCRPRAPLHTVNGAQVAGFGVGPFVPNGHATLLQPARIAVATQKPQQLVNDAFEVHLFGRHQRKALLQIKAHLVAKHAARAGAGAVGLFNARVTHMAQKSFVLIRYVRVGGAAHKKILAKLMMFLCATPNCCLGAWQGCGSKSHLKAKAFCPDSWCFSGPAPA